MVLNGTSGDFRIYPAEGDGDVSGTSGNILIQNAQLEVSDFGPTDYIPTTTAAVSVGPVSGLPRLDYSGGCPSLLLEPQRTNLALWSEQFDDAAWVKTYTTITANSTTSPNGYNNADKLVADVLTSNHWIEKIGYSSFSIGTHTMSIYAKAGGSNFVQIATSSGFAATYQNYNLSNGTKGNGNVSSAGYSTSIEAIGTNGWYRITFTAANPSSDARFLIVPILSDVATRNPTFLGNGTDGVYIWGAQIEFGSYPTSYIPTLGSAVSRNTDSAYKTGISSLIGQTEGTFFVEIQGYTDALSGNTFFGITESTANNRLLIGQSSTANQFRFYVDVDAYGGGFNYSVTDITEPQKLAIVYSNSGNDIALYLNGAQKTSFSTSNTFSASLTDLVSNNGAGTQNAEFNVKQIIVFPTALTEAQAIELTTL
jgi:hypothetical protein